MSHIWTFSPSSEKLVNKCITAAPPPDLYNKWIVRFGCKSLDPNITLMKPSEHLQISKVELSEVPPTVNHESHAGRSEENVEMFQEFFEVIEQEPILKFDYLIEECTKNERLLIYLASKLSITSIEKICKHVFYNKNIDPIFIDKFHRHFIPNLLKREYNWFSLDVLIRSQRNYPEAFKLLLITVTKDINIANNVLQDFITALNDEELSGVMSIITELELTTEEFRHNLLSIYTAYKNCKKNIRVQNFISANIIKCAQHCSSDKQFGRLLLAFLQSQKELKYPLNSASLERVIESHKSPFRRPCLNIFNELIERIAMETTVDNSES